MKTSTFLFALLTLGSITLFGQKLDGYLDGFSTLQLPTDRPIVGSKWATGGIGVTTPGLNESELTISQSLSNISLSSTNQIQLKITLLNHLGLSNYSDSEIKVVFNNLQVFTIPNLYAIPLVKDEMIVFAALKSESFDLIVDKSISASVLAKLQIPKVNITAEAALGNETRVTLHGNNLFIAAKIVKIKKVKTKTSTKKLFGDFTAQDIAGYDISVKFNKLLSTTEKLTIEEIGTDKFNQLEIITPYFNKNAYKEKIYLNVSSRIYGSSTKGIYSYEVPFCYCQLLQGEKQEFLINTMYPGNSIVYDYAFLEDFIIDVSHFKITPYATVTSAGKPVVVASTKKYSKFGITRISFEYDIVLL